MDKKWKVSIPFTLFGENEVFVEATKVVKDSNDKDVVIGNIFDLDNNLIYESKAWLLSEFPGTLSQSDISELRQ